MVRRSPALLFAIMSMQLLRAASVTLYLQCPGQAPETASYANQFLTAELSCNGGVNSIGGSAARLKPMVALALAGPDASAWVSAETDLEITFSGGTGTGFVQPCIFMDAGPARPGVSVTGLAYSHAFAGDAEMILNPSDLSVVTTVNQCVSLQQFQFNVPIVLRFRYFSLAQNNTFAEAAPGFRTFDSNRQPQGYAGVGHDVTPPDLVVGPLFIPEPSLRVLTAIPLFLLLYVAGTLRRVQQPRRGSHRRVPAVPQ
jgi:hypothetical protein